MKVFKLQELTSNEKQNMANLNASFGALNNKICYFKNNIVLIPFSFKMMFHAFHDMCYTSKYETFIKIIWLRTSMHDSKAPVQVQWDSLLKIDLSARFQESLTPVNDDLYWFYGISIQGIFCFFEAFQEVQY